MTTRLSGILSALATPFTPEGDVDEPGLRRLVDRNIDGGVTGVVAGGSTGEFAAMTARPSAGCWWRRWSTRRRAGCPWWRRPGR